MNYPEIVIASDVDLHRRIMQLNCLKEEQEQVIKKKVKEMVYAMHPNVVLKNAVNKFLEDPEAGDNLGSLGLHLGRDFLIMKLFGKKGSLKGFISSLIVRKATDYFIDNHSDLLSAGINKLATYFKDMKIKTN